MTAPAQAHLEPGRVYRTHELSAFSANPPRLAKRLTYEGRLVPLGRGLFACPRQGRFGVVPPSDAELMRGFLDGAPFVFTGPEQWNALGLGSTAVFSASLVYNTKRSGELVLAGRRFLLRRVSFPSSPPKEWFAVDLFENAEQAGVARRDLATALTRALSRGELDVGVLRAMAGQYATKPTRKLIATAIEEAGL